MIRKMEKQKKPLDPMVIRRYLVMLTIVLVIGLTALNIWLARGVKQETLTMQGTEQPADGFGKADIGGDFTMTDQNGKAVQFSSTNGKLRLVFFGFTNCPDICPVTMLTLTNVMNSLGGNADQVQPVFITVDPERDTPSVMKDYVSNFHPSVLALSGTKEQTDQATQAFKVFYSVNKIEDSPKEKVDHSEHTNHAEHSEHMSHADHSAHGGVQVDHSGFIYLLDRDGNYLAHFEHNAAEKKILDAMQPYLNAVEK
jgi:protein SCO1/2